MKTTRILLVILGAWFILSLGSGVPRGVAGESNRTTATPSTVQQKKDYQKNVESKLKELNQELKVWKDKSAKMEKEARSEMEKQINKLSKKEKEVSKRLKELQTKTGNAWEDFKAGLDSAMEDLGKAFDRMRSRFKSP